MDSLLRKKSVRLSDEVWAQHIKTWSTSGLTQRRYCEQNGISSRLFSYRKSKLSRTAAQGSADQAFIPLIADTMAPSKHTSLCGVMTLTLPNGIALSFDTVPAIGPVAELATVLARIPC